MHRPTGQTEADRDLARRDPFTFDEPKDAKAGGIPEGCTDAADVVVVRHGDSFRLKAANKTILRSRWEPRRKLASASDFAPLRPYV